MKKQLSAPRPAADIDRPPASAETWKRDQLRYHLQSLAQRGGGERQGSRTQLTLKSDAGVTTSATDGKLSIHAPLLFGRGAQQQPSSTARVTPTFLKTYEPGSLHLREGDLWLKMAMEMDERQKTRMVSVRTIGTPRPQHDVIEAGSVYMKISSTRRRRFYYSLDKTSWQLIRLFKNDYPARSGGISTQSPLGEGTSAVFETCP